MNPAPGFFEDESLGSVGDFLDQFTDAFDLPAEGDNGGSPDGPGSDGTQTSEDN